MQNTQLKTQLIFNIPDRNTPGFARRMATVLDFQKRIKESAGMVDVDTWKAIVQFLAGYVKADTPAQAEELVWMASQEQLESLLAAVAGSMNDESASVSPPSGGPSEKP